MIPSMAQASEVSIYYFLPIVLRILSTPAAPTHIHILVGPNCLPLEGMTERMSGVWYRHPSKDMSPTLSKAE